MPAPFEVPWGSPATMAYPWPVSLKPSMAMKVVFIRHSHPDRGSNSEDPDLTSHGVAVAREAAAWLAAQGLVPSLVVHSKWRRCAQTAALIASSVGGQLVPKKVRTAIPARTTTWDSFVLGELPALVGADGTVAVVGSHGTQGMLTKRFGVPPIPGDNRCAVVVLTDAGGVWTREDWWPGQPPA